MSTSDTVNRRRFLRNAIGASAAQTAPQASPNGMLPFVEHYTSNTTADLTAANNAAVDILSGMARLWRTGAKAVTGITSAR